MIPIFASFILMVKAPPPFSLPVIAANILQKIFKNFVFCWKRQLGNQETIYPAAVKVIIFRLLVS